MPVTLREFRQVVKNSLRGFAVVELPSGIVIHDISLHNSHGKTWAAMPAKPQMDGAGAIRQIDGKTQYKKIVEWRDRDLSDRFSVMVCDLVREQHPKALD